MKKKSRFNNRFALFFAAVLLACTVPAIVLIGKQRERSRLQYEQDRKRMNRLLDLYKGLLDRHPDLRLSEARSFYRRFTGLEDEEKVDLIGDLGRRYLAAEEKARELMGEEKGPGDPGYRTFSPNGFKEFFDSLSLPHAVPVEKPLPITGHPEADRRIVLLAERRGYRLRPEAEPERLMNIGRHRLQPEAYEAWLRLSQAAREEGIHLGLISAYRSISRQREIFLDLLRRKSLEIQDRELTPEEIGKGAADTMVEEILKGSSIPGYSKHHSGYTIDITDLSSGLDFTEFRQTKGFVWISAYNYRNAKRFGFIPSYPRGARGQGPEPEAWEYVWVGEELLRREPLPDIKP